MALTDVLFRSDNSAFAYRGNVGVIGNLLFDETSAWNARQYDGGYWTVSGTFKTSAGVNLPDGTEIIAVHCQTFLPVGRGFLSGGSVSIQVSTPDNIYLIANPQGLSGETVCTTAITPG